LNDRYYTEHLYIDAFHSKMMRGSIKALGQDRPVDLAKVWAGIQVTRATVLDATEAAVDRARSVA
jgi:hypothetical protein